MQENNFYISGQDFNVNDRLFIWLNTRLIPKFILHLFLK